MRNNIAALRKKKNISQKDFAQMVGISYWWLNHIENGKRDPSLKLVRKIADKLDVEPKDIFLT